MRMTVTRGSMGISEKDGGLQPDSVVQDSDDDPRRQRAGAEAVPRSEARRDDSRRARALLAVLDPQGAHDRERAARPSATTAGFTPISARPTTRTVLPRDVRHALGRSPRGSRLDVEPRLARARHPFQRRGDRAARQGGRRRLPLRRLQHGAGVGHLPDLRARGGGRRRSASASTARPPTIRRT